MCVYFFISFQHTFQIVWCLRKISNISFVIFLKPFGCFLFIYGRILYIYSIIYRNKSIYSEYIYGCCQLLLCSAFANCVLYFQRSGNNSSIVKDARNCNKLQECDLNIVLSFILYTVQNVIPRQMPYILSLCSIIQPIHLLFIQHLYIELDYSYVRSYIHL